MYFQTWISSFGVHTFFSHYANLTTKRFSTQRIVSAKRNFASSQCTVDEQRNLFRINSIFTSFSAFYATLNAISLYESIRNPKKLITLIKWMLVLVNGDLTHRLAYVNSYINMSYCVVFNTK